jgi:hypothetical protein
MELGVCLPSYLDMAYYANISTISIPTFKWHVNYNENLN